MALGCFGVAVSYLILAGAAWFAGSGPATWRWLFAYFAVITLGELYLSPIGLSLVSKIAPARMISTMMGLWLATSLHRQFCCWLARQLLEYYGQNELLHHDCLCRCWCRHGDLVLQSSAQRQSAGLAPVESLIFSGTENIC